MVLLQRSMAPMHFANPLAFLLLVVVATELWLLWPTRQRGGPQARVGFPTLELLRDPAHRGRARWMILPSILRTCGLVLLVVALARPRSVSEIRDLRLRGRNIVLTLDISSSMKALDFKTGNRLEVAKRVLTNFIPQRRQDFIGLVVFAGKAFMQAPLTTDMGVLLELLRRADIGMLPDGTAIGTALTMGENRLKELPRGSGVIVLITDGGNNTGYPDPLTAAAVAHAIGVRIYTVGVSSRGATPVAPYVTGRPATMEAPSALSTAEERLLRQIATVSGGRYYRASDDAALASIMIDIDRLEKTELHLREVERYREYYPVVLGAALLLLAADIVLRSTWLRTIP